MDHNVDTPAAQTVLKKTWTRESAWLVMALNFAFAFFALLVDNAQTALAVLGITFIPSMAFLTTAFLGQTYKNTRAAEHAAKVEMPVGDDFRPSDADQDH